MHGGHTHTLLEKISNDFLYCLDHSTRHQLLTTLISEQHIYQQDVITARLNRELVVVFALIPNAASDIYNGL